MSFAVTGRVEGRSRGPACGDATPGGARAADVIMPTSLWNLPEAAVAVTSSAVTKINPRITAKLVTTKFVTVKLVTVKLVTSSVEDDG